MQVRLDIQGLSQFKQQLESMMVHMETGGSRSLQGGEKNLYSAIRRYMNEAEAELRKATIQRLGAMMPNDPRGAHVSISRGKVRSKKGMIYGTVGIYQPKTAGSKKATYEPERTLRQGQRGGNRRPRSQRTNNIMTYGPRDRGFILRFLEGGTTSRNTKYGNRGAIAATHRFARAAEGSVEQVTQSLVQKIDAHISKLMSQGKM